MNDKDKVAQIITEQVIKGLEQGHIPWHKPWHIAGSDSGAKNFATKHEYTGVNILLTWLYCEEFGWKYPYFATIKQIDRLSGKVNKGEKSNIITFTKAFERMVEEEEDGEIVRKTKRFYMLRYYRVFNIEQTDIDIKKYAPKVDKQRVNTLSSHRRSEALIKLNNPTIKKGGRVCYNPIFDTIAMPLKDSFDSKEEYYLTNFHELVHWSGHKSRLDRLETTFMGTEKYTKEELVAEIGANMCSMYTGVTRKIIKNSQAYINHWLKRLQDDPKFIIQAASKAQKAYEYLKKEDKDNAT